MNPNMPDNTPFSIDAHIPEIDPGGLSDPFLSTGGKYPRKSNKTLYWIIGIGFAVVILVIILITVGVAAYYLLPQYLEKPETTVQKFYEAMSVQDVALARTFNDPDDPQVIDLLPMLTDIKKRFEETARKTINYQLDIGWQFQEMKYTPTSNDRKTAIVQVSGKVYVFDKTSKIGLTFPYNATHQLVFKNRKWYLKMR
ncbi:MAG TPA: hypothetical protein VIO61_14375 [Anaerolineaceae bacterium]